ncbi:MAG: ABC transporter permease [Bacteroidota bacterium]
MIKNLLLVAIRNFKKDKGYSFLNILGLTIGITFSLFLIFYVKDELSFDRHNEKVDRIVRINSYIKEPENSMKIAITQSPLAPALKKDFPEVEEAVRFVGNGRMMFKNGELHLYEDNVFYSDSNLFKVFTYQFVEGRPENALTEPRSLMLTQTSAEKYFGKNKSVVGQSLRTNNGDVYKVTAVIKDVPKNSHLIFNALISMSSLPNDFFVSWGNLQSVYLRVT